MKGGNKNKRGHLGPAFNQYLEWLEYIESVLTSGKMPAKQKHVAINNDLFKIENDQDMQSVMQEMIPVDAWLATCVRSSVKYKMDVSTCGHLIQNYENELRYIRNTYPVNLPHEWCTVVVEDGDDTFIFCLQETDTKTGGDYPELGVAKGEKWICANLALHRKGGLEMLDDGLVHREHQLSAVPVEIHFEKGKLWEEMNLITTIPKGVTVTDKGEKAIQLFRGFISLWLEQFHLSSVLRSKQVGIKPVPSTYKPKRRRKRHEFPQFEHTIIKMEMDAPDSQQTGRSMFQPRKRLHQVRGFWRHMKKTGKKVWVRPHWRGDEHLGVIKRDVELVTHDEVNHG